MATAAVASLPTQREIDLHARWLAEMGEPNRYPPQIEKATHADPGQHPRRRGKR